MAQDDLNDVVLQRITITRQLKADGAETYRVEYDADINFVADLGLLEAAKHDLYERMRELPNLDNP